MSLAGIMYQESRHNSGELSLNSWLDSCEDQELSVNLLLNSTVEIFDHQHLNLVIKIKLEKKNSNY